MDIEEAKNFARNKIEADALTKQVSGEGQGSGSRGEQGAGGYGRQEKKGRAAGSLRWREAGEKFKKASFRYLLLLIIQSKKRTQQRFLTSI